MGNQAKQHSYNNKIIISQNKSLISYKAEWNKHAEHHATPMKQNLSPLLTELLRAGLALHFFRPMKVLGLMK